MSFYTPSQIPLEVQDHALRRFLQNELSIIARALSEPDDKKRYRVLYAQPVKFNEGDTVYADGTKWNPGSGAGVYRRGATGWVFLG